MIINGKGSYNCFAIDGSSIVSSFTSQSNSYL